MEGSEDQTTDGLEKEEAGSKEGEEGEEVSLVTDSQLMAVAETLGSKWRQLATELGYAEDDMAQWENKESDTASTLNMLSTWKVSVRIIWWMAFLGPYQLLVMQWFCAMFFGIILGSKFDSVLHTENYDGLYGFSAINLEVSLIST